MKIKKPEAYCCPLSKAVQFNLRIKVIVNSICLKISRGKL